MKRWYVAINLMQGVVEGQCVLANVYLQDEGSDW